MSNRAATRQREGRQVPACCRPRPAGRPTCWLGSVLRSPPAARSCVYIRGVYILPAAACAVLARCCRRRRVRVAAAAIARWQTAHAGDRCWRGSDAGRAAALTTEWRLCSANPRGPSSVQCFAVAGLLKAFSQDAGARQLWEVLLPPAGLRSTARPVCLCAFRALAGISSRQLSIQHSPGSSQNGASGSREAER